MAMSLHFRGISTARESSSFSILSFNRKINAGASLPIPVSGGAFVKRSLAVRCCAQTVNSPATAVLSGEAMEENRELSVVMKFGGSSLASAARMKEAADLILSFPDECPLIVLSAMGKTTNNLLNAGGKAVTCGATKASDVSELSIIRDLHLRFCSAEDVRNEYFTDENLPPNFCKSDGL